MQEKLSKYVSVPSTVEKEGRHSGAMNKTNVMRTIK